MSPCCTSLLPCLSIIPSSQLHTCLSSYLLLSKCSLNLVMLLLRKEKKRLLAQKNAPEMYCMHTAQPTEFHDPKLLNLTPTTQFCNECRVLQDFHTTQWRPLHGSQAERQALLQNQWSPSTHWAGRQTQPQVSSTPTTSRTTTAKPKNQYWFTAWKIITYVSILLLFTICTRQQEFLYFCLCCNCTNTLTLKVAQKMSRLCIVADQYENKIPWGYQIDLNYLPASQQGNSSLWMENISCLSWH